MRQTVRDVTRELLRELGLTTIFGNPGTTEIGFLRDFPNDFRYVLGLQESVAVAMADGYAHASGSAVLVNLHSAGGVGHGLGHVFTAYRNNTPMIVLAGQQVRSLMPGEPFLGAMDATLFPRPYVKWAVEPARPQDVPAALAHAHRVATQPPRGPVFVSVPADDWDAECAPLPLRPPVPGFWPDPEAIAGLAAALAVAERPALVAGPGVDAEGAIPDLVALAERTRSLVWASPMAWRGCFPEDHPQFAGFLPPEERGTVEALSHHDLVVVLGAPAFLYHVFRGAAELTLPPLYLVSDDEQVLARASAGVGIRSGVGAAVRALTAVAAEPSRPAPTGRTRRPRPPRSTPLTVDWVFSVLADVLPEDVLLVEEIPSHLLVRREYLPVRAPRTGLLSTGGGALGYGLPAAVGAAIGAPHRPVVAVLGDGSSMYSIQALWTAAREHLPVTFVVLDNAQYAAVDILAGPEGGKMPGVELGGIDFPSLATSLGCRAHRVTHPDDLEPTIATALTTAEPTLVHIPVDPKPTTLY
ncbi:benzoylformate decarboxylase [Actinophytocola xanthii]|uniref:Benzoylformate decarboxylase n=1 Tax=Actinophytocola xanthii TaxID=1912961 RepID=A0A1Q8CTK8_9PSEU|nr:benzoylformate decarboxylase [Actinophytocola xanthii]OLF17711.1 benzoylformate decarboxylase [Actinophytocola xanthii]